MRKLCAVLSTLIFIGFLASCGENDTPAYSARQMADVIVSTQSELPILSLMTTEEEHFAERLANVYQLDPDSLADGAVYCAVGAEADEIAVFELAEDAAPEEVEAALTQYIKQRAADFAGYFPAEAALAENGAVARKGGYVALMICEDPTAARSAFLDCFSGTPPALPSAPIPTAPAESTEPPADAETVGYPVGGYDPGAILAAWESGDRSVLDAKNREILDFAAGVIGKQITEEMADDEQERVIHDWIIGWVAYDDALMSNAPHPAHAPDNDNPCGALLYQTAQCEGYALTFQLFMDLLDIECVTVYGTSSRGKELHTWNMVRLADGQWYCVDVTWDDTANVTDREDVAVSYQFFNVTSEFMRENDHQWDEAAAPVATSTNYQQAGR